VPSAIVAELPRGEARRVCSARLDGQGNPHRHECLYYKTAVSFRAAKIFRGFSRHAKVDSGGADDRFSSSAARQAAQNEGLPHGFSRHAKGHSGMRRRRAAHKTFVSFRPAKIPVGQTIVFRRLPPGRPHKTRACPTASVAARRGIPECGAGALHTKPSFLSAPQNDSLPHGFSRHAKVDSGMRRRRAVPLYCQTYFDS
jgi:hypothetical protein